MRWPLSSGERQGVEVPIAAFAAHPEVPLLGFGRDAEMFEQRIFSECEDFIEIGLKKEFLDQGGSGHPAEGDTVVDVVNDERAIV